MFRRLPFLTRFTIVSLAVTILIAVGFTWLLTREIVRVTLEAAADTAASAVTFIISPEVFAKDFSGPTPENIATWERRVQRIMGTANIVRVKVWSKTGQIIYSDNPTIIGRTFPPEENEDLREALEGDVAMEVSDLSSSEDATERHYGRLLEVYVPIKPADSNQIEGVYEVYTSYVPLQARIAELQRVNWTGSAIAFTLLFASLFLIARGASRQLNQLASFTELNPNPILETDPSGRPTYSNPATRRTFPDLEDGQPPELKTALATALSGMTTGSGSAVRELKIDHSHYEMVSYPTDENLIRSYLLDVTERKKAEESTQRYLQRLSILRAIDLAITSSLDLRVTLNVFLDQASAHLGVDAVDVLLLNPNMQTLEYSAGRGFRSRAIEQTRIRLGEGLAGRAALERTAISIPNLTAVGKDFTRDKLITADGFVSYFAAPLIAKGEVKGVLEMFTRTPFSPDHEWLDFVEALAGQAAIAVDNSNLFDGIQRANLDLTLAYDATLEGWSRALDLRDRETEGHTQRVAELTVMLAEAIGIRGSDLVNIRRGALLHDIGKLAVPDSILFKPGPLTDDEWRVMKRHPVAAYEMLASIPYLRTALDIPYAHHEKWDGTGYPRGLRGVQIPQAARVFAIADVWDALRSNRPYRSAWSEEQARSYINEQREKHFDPEVVEAFFRLEM
ncbi:MAG TPA: HD domain-containing phosphohydrolase [bacterium]|nr:HD domain-containing phosphohydrolase [bacterium]